MKTRYRMIRRGSRRGAFYCVDTQSGKRFSLQTDNEDRARQIIEAKNQAERQPALNLQIARAYLAGCDSGNAQRTWQHALDELTARKQGNTQKRWHRAAKDKAFDLIRHRLIVETQADTLLKTLHVGTVSTNAFLRSLHNFCLDMSWLPWPILPKRQWPEIRFKEKRGITREEHQKILAGERNREWIAYYNLLWHIGGAQTDVANLCAEDVDWTGKFICFHRKKTGSLVQLHFGPELENLLNDLPGVGLLFPNLARMRDSDRASLFSRRCRLVGISGVSLHSYRYAWAERALTAGYPERFAQQALGHNSKAVHRAYAKKALVKLPSLEEYEQKSQPSLLP